MSKFGPLVGAIDEGTSSARFILFRAGTSDVVASHQMPLSQRYPREGWVEQDPLEILDVVAECVDRTVEKLIERGGAVADVVAVGVANQRESTVLWDRTTGTPLHDSIVWLDVRTSSTVEELLDRVPNKTRNKDYLKPLCGLPLSPYFSATKIRWLSRNVRRVADAIGARRCAFGTIDSWLIWNLTGGADGGGAHVTDATNASRTMLMNVDTLEWDDVLVDFFDVPRDILPAIRSSSEVYGAFARGPLKGVPICGCLGDQQAALVGQGCLSRGDAKATYGTGCFLLCNTGAARVESAHGLLTTVAYQLGPDAAPVYALEGSVAVAGAAIQWLKDNVELVDDVRDVERIATGVDTDVYFVPAFSGLYAPYWQKDARGLMCGISEDTTSADIVRATLEAVCYQTRDILDAMNRDCGAPLDELKVDGGMTANALLMQLQSDLTGIPVVRRDMAETTALGAAMVAGAAAGVWDLSAPVGLSSTTFRPQRTEDERDVRYAKWKAAIERSIGWAV